jgi:hypothetical protein
MHLTAASLSFYLQFYTAINAFATNKIAQNKFNYAEVSASITCTQNLTPVLDFKTIWGRLDRKIKSENCLMYHGTNTGRLITEVQDEN